MAIQRLDSALTAGWELMDYSGCSIRFIKGKYQIQVVYNFEEKVIIVELFEFGKYCKSFNSLDVVNPLNEMLEQVSQLPQEGQYRCQTV